MTRKTMMIAKRMNPTRSSLLDSRCKVAVNLGRAHRSKRGSRLGLRGHHPPEPWRYGQAWRHREGGRKLAQRRACDMRGVFNSLLGSIRGDRKGILPKPLGKVSVVVRIWRRAAAEKAERGGGRDLVPGAGRNQDRVAGCDRTLFSVDFHRALAFQQEIELLTFLMVVPIR